VVPGPVRVGLHAAKARARSLPGPFDDELARRDAPVALAPLDAVYVTAAADVQRGAVATSLHEQHVALGVGNVALDVHADVRDVVRVRVPLGGEQIEAPRDELVAAAQEVPVAIDRIAVVGRREDLRVVAVEAARVG